MSETDNAKKRDDMTFPRRWIASMLILAALVFSAIAPTPTLAQEAAETDPAPSNLELLLDVIENDDSRAALIDELRAAQSEAETPVDDQIVETLAGEDAPPEELSFSRRIALVTQAAAQDIATGSKAPGPRSRARRGSSRGSVVARRACCSKPPSSWR